MAARKKPSKAIATWDEELAKEAEIAAGLEANTGGGQQFFSLQGGTLSWQDSPLPNNEMAVIIIDGIFENVFYEGRYDSDNPQGPTCFAFAREEDDLEPHKIVHDAGQNQNNDCKTCEHNEWGSADTGKGKACKNTRRLAMIPAGTFNRDGSFEAFDDPDHYTKAEVAFMRLPVTSIKGYASFVKQVAGALKRPPFGIITRVAIVQDAKTQFKVIFEPLEKVSDELMGAIMQRREEVMATIDFPYQLDDGEEEAPRSRAAKKPAAKKAVKKPAAKSKRKY